MATTDQSPEARELSLVGKVEMRIALTDTDEKLQSILGTYLAPLLLKLASEHVSVRNKVISICQHINTRIKPQSIKLPVAALVEQFKNNPNTPLIRHFDLLYIQNGIRRMAPKESAALFPSLLHGLASTSQASVAHASQLFNFMLQLVGFFQLPPRGSKEDVELRSSLKLGDDDAAFLAFWFGKLVLFAPVKNSSNVVSAPGSVCPGLSQDEYAFLSLQNKADTWNTTSPLGLSLTEAKVRAARLLASGMFKDSERFLPALFASAEPVSSVADVGEDILKRCLPNISLEDTEIVQTLFRYYFGDESAQGLQRVRVPLRLKIIGLLNKSTKSTSFSEEIIRLVNDGITTPSGGDAILSPDYSSVASTSGREASKLRSSIFTYINFAARFGDAHSLHTIAPRVLGRLRDFIEGQGWPRPADNEDLVSRGYAYEVIGLLAKAGPKELIMEPNLDILRWLFESSALETAASSMNVSVDEALSSVLGAFSKGTDKDTALSLENLLLDQMHKSDVREQDNARQRRSTRYAAVRFANRSLPFTSLKARWIDLLAMSATGDRPEVAEEGRRGLSPYWFRMLNGANDAAASSNDFVFPDFVELMDFIFYKTPSQTAAAPSETPLGSVVDRFRRELPLVFPEALKYSRRIFLHEALQASLNRLPLDGDWELKLDTAIRNDENIRTMVKEKARSISEEQSNESQAFSLLVVSFSAGLLSRREGDAYDGDADKLFIDICALCPDKLVATVAPHYSNLLPSIYSNKITQRQIAAHAFGILASYSCAVAGDQKGVNAAVQELLSKTSNWKDAVGAGGNQVHGAIISLGHYFSRYSSRSGLNLASVDEFKRYLALLQDVLLHANDFILREASFSSLAELSLFQTLKLDMFGSIDDFVAVVDKTAEVAKAGNERAALALGQYSMILEEDDEISEEASKAPLNYIKTRLHKLHEIRQAETHFSVGEALSFVACGWKSKALATRMDIDCAAPANPARNKTLQVLLKQTLADCHNTKPSLRKASVIWLLCLVQYCGHLEEVNSHLPACQAAFKRCLTDRDELVQETAARGLGLVYEKGSRSIKDDLVRDLVGSFSENKTQLAGNVGAETQLFDAGSLPTGDGSITTYKDIMSLASEMGDSSLVYRFMSLASSNAIWSSRAAFGRFGLSNVLSDSSVDGYLANNPRLYPKLFRYRFDPNSSVQRSMTDIWNALVKDSSATIDQHFDAIMEDLLANILGREWRTRQASCAAIAELVQGRSLDKYEKYLERIWTLCFKVLDDIKESVRSAAAALARVLTNVLTRTLEADTSSRNAGAMLKHVLPFLLSPSGLESSAQEVQVFALQAMLEIVKKGSGKTLQPFIPELVERLLAMLSSLEHEAVNYIHLNAKKYNLTEQKIDDMRLSNIRSSPLMEAVERCLDLLNDTSMQELQPRLESAMKTAIGLPSKVGCSRVLVSLSTRHNLLFKPYSDTFLRLLEKHVLDRNDTVSSSYAAAAGYVARGASDRQILHIVNFSKKLYFESDRDQAIPRRCIAAGEILHAVADHATDRFNSLAVDIIPFVFFAKHDSNEQVAQIFQEIWASCASSRGVLLYLNEITDLVKSHLDSAQWVIKHTAARSVADAVETIASTTSEIDATTAATLWVPLETSMAAKSWDGKSLVLDAFAKWVERSEKYWSGKPEIVQAIKKIALREAKRNNESLKPFGVRCLARTLTAVAKRNIDLAVDMAGALYDILTPIFADLAAEKDGDPMDVDHAGGHAISSTIDEVATMHLTSLKMTFTGLYHGPDQTRTVVDDSHLERTIQLILALAPLCKYSHRVDTAVKEVARSALDCIKERGYAGDSHLLAELL